MNETGEFKRGTIGEGKARYRVETWGKVIGITRQVIINDDLDAFTRVPSLFGTAAATLESDVVWGIVTSNPAMADGVALFHANHKNLTGTGTALDVANLGKGRTAMAKQTGLDGKTVLNVRPAFLVVPSSLELTAEQMIAQNLVPATVANVVPASIRSLAVIAEPRLDPASGAVPWSPVRQPLGDRHHPSTPPSRARTASSSRPGSASTSTALRSRPGSTSAPRPSTGAACTAIRGWRCNPADLPLARFKTEVTSLLSLPSGRPLSAALFLSMEIPMKTYIAPGHSITVTAPSGGVTSGQGVLIGTLFGIAQADGAEGTDAELLTEGVVEVAKTSALQIDVGDRLFWDATNKVVNKTATAQVCVGVAVSAAANPSATVKMKLGARTPAGT